MEKSSRRRSRLLLFLAAFLFSTGGAAIKASSLTSWQVAGGRSGIAAIVLLFLLPATRRNWNWRIGLTGLAYAATLICFVIANKLTTSANAIFLQSTAPLYMLALGPLVLHEKIRRFDLAVFAAIAAGAVLLLRGSAAGTAIAADPARGNLIALAAGFAWAWTLTGLRWLGKHGDPWAGTSTVLTGNLIVLAVCLPLSLPVRASPSDLAVLVYLGVFQVALAYVFLTRSIRHVPAMEAATLLLVEPVFNPIWTWLLHGERPGLLAIAGGGVIVVAAYLGTWFQSL